jgi:hypothetical protein
MSSTAAAQSSDPACPATLCVPATVPSNANILSPPIVAPIATCTSVVSVSGYVTGATIDVFVGASLLTSFTPTVPDSSATNVSAALFTVTGSTTFGAGQMVRAQQRLGPASSLFSEWVTVTTRAGNLPTPTISAPLYQCGRIVATQGVERGMTVTVTNVPTTGGSTGWSFTALSDNPIIQTVGHAPEFRFRAQTQLCAATSALGPLESVIPVSSGPPEPLAPPVLVNGTAIVGQRDLDFDGAVLGAELRVRVNGTAGGPVFVSALPGQRFRVRLPVPLNLGDTVSVGQRLCGATPSYGPTVSTGSCATLPPPQIRLPRTGDRVLRLQVRWPGATILAFVGTEQVARGGGDVLALTRPLAAGETLTVFQTVGTCTSSSAFRTTVQCTQQDFEFDPSLGGPYAVGSAEYQGPSLAVPGANGPVLVRGIVRYPMDRAGPTQRLARWAGPRPLVLVMHGRAPTLRQLPVGPTPVFEYDLPRSERMARIAAGTHEAIDAAQGYDELLTALARSGIIAVSIDAEDLVSTGNSSALLDAGADLFVQHLAYWNTLNTTGVAPAPGFSGGVPASDFLGRVDLSRVGLVGHSRSGERVIRVPGRVAASSLSGVVTIRGALLIAPLAELSSSPAGMPFVVLGGSRDLDTVVQPVALYDRMGEPGTAVPERFLEWVYGATHRDWNSRLTAMLTPEPGTLGGGAPWAAAMLPTPVVAAEQVAMVRIWGRYFFEWLLQGRNEITARAVLNADSVVRGLGYANVLPSHARASDVRIDSFRVDSPTFPAFDLPGTASFSGFPSVNQFNGRGPVTPADDGGLAVFTGHARGVTGGAGGEIRYDLSTPISAVNRQFIFRVAKLQCNGLEFDTGGCLSARETEGLGVEVTVRSGATSRTVAVSSTTGAALIPGRFVPTPWAYSNSTLFSAWASSVPRTVRIPQSCFGSTPSGFWASVTSVSIRVVNSSESVVVSDISLAE